MGTSVTGDWMGGGGCADVGIALHHSGSGGTPIQIVDVDHVPMDGEYFDWFLT